LLFIPGSLAKENTKSWQRYVLICWGSLKGAHPDLRYFGMVLDCELKFF
jgi:hypothetical protein